MKRAVLRLQRVGSAGVDLVAAPFVGIVPKATVVAWCVFEQYVVVLTAGQHYQVLGERVSLSSVVDACRGSEARSDLVS